MAKRKKSKIATPNSQAAYEQKISRLRDNFLVAKRAKEESQRKKAKKDVRLNHPGWRKYEGSIPSLITKLVNYSHEQLIGMHSNYMHWTAGRRTAEIPHILLELHEALNNEWKRRYEGLCEGKASKWPTTEAMYGTGNLNSNAWPDEGMLKLFGYHVGQIAGVAELRRWQILDEIFALNLPPINSFTYMEKWGLPKTLARLQRMAETIAALTRNAKGSKRASMEVACEEWESDLAHIFLKYRVAYFGLDKGRRFREISGWQTDT